MVDVLGRLICNKVFIDEQFGNELVCSSSSNPDLSIYAAKRSGDSITIMVIILSLDEETQSLKIENESSYQADT